MLTGLFFKCADGARFHVDIHYHESFIEGGFGIIEIHDEHGEEKAWARFWNDNDPKFGKYQVLSRMIKKAGIFNHGGISHAGSQINFPYNKALFDQHVRNEQKIRLSLRLTTKHWGATAVSNCTYKHKFTEK